MKQLSENKLIYVCGAQSNSEIFEVMSGAILIGVIVGLTTHHFSLNININQNIERCYAFKMGVYIQECSSKIFGAITSKIKHN